MTYEVIVCRLTNVRPHPNADKLKLATVAGSQIVVGLDVVEDELGLFFDCDGKTSTEYCEANDLYPRFDVDGTRVGGGFFDPKNNRIRAQKFRGEKSEGYFAPLESVAYTGYDISQLAEGQRFSELNGKLIAEKYYTPKTLNAMNGGTPKTRKEIVQFPKHVDTKQFRFYKDQVPEGALVTITLKMHGTSQRSAYAQDTETVKNGLLRRLLRRPERSVTAYKNMLGTRNVILGETHETGFYNDESFRYTAAQQFHGNLHKGEVVYYELVGYTTTGEPIMGAHSTKDQKELKKQYGPEIVYTYGQVPGTCGVYVYRIVNVNEDGVAYELPWEKVKARCSELGVNHVPEMRESFIHTGTSQFMLDSNVSSLLEVFVAEHVSGPDPLDPSHIREGVVIRVDHRETDFYKEKSFDFKVLEGIVKNDESYVDTEEVA